MNKLSQEKQSQVIAALVEGNSINSAMEAGITDHVWTIEEMLSKIGQ